jgi:hypothetical protein
LGINVFAEFAAGLEQVPLPTREDIKAAAHEVLEESPRPL